MGKKIKISPAKKIYILTINLEKSQILTHIIFNVKCFRVSAHGFVHWRGNAFIPGHRGIK